MCSQVWHLSTKAVPPPTALCEWDRVSPTSLPRYFGDDQLPTEQLPAHRLYSEAHSSVV